MVKLFDHVDGSSMEFSYQISSKSWEKYFFDGFHRFLHLFGRNLKTWYSVHDPM